MDTAAAWFYFGLIGAGTLVLCGLAWALERPEPETWVMRPGGDNWFGEYVAPRWERIR